MFLFIKILLDIAKYCRKVWPSVGGFLLLRLGWEVFAVLLRCIANSKPLLLPTFRLLSCFTSWCLCVIPKDHLASSASQTEGQPQGPEGPALEIPFYRIMEGLSDVSLGRSFLELFYFTAVGPKNDLGEFLRKCTFLAPVPEILIWHDCDWEPAICILPQLPQKTATQVLRGNSGT